MAGLVDKKFTPLLLIGNPHGLHAQTLLEGIEAGFENIIVDKPVCVVATIFQTKKCEARRGRMSWLSPTMGPQTIKKMIDAGEFGEIISVEGRYWQSSSAQWATEKSPTSLFGKRLENDPKLHGPYDALVDLGAHYTDMMFFFAGSEPEKIFGLGKPREFSRPSSRCSCLG